MKKLTVVVPCFNAEKTLDRVLSSIQCQTIFEDVEVILAQDDENDYSSFIERYNLDIKAIPCEKNTGPGLARQRGLDAATTDWVTFIDADDSFYSVDSLEALYDGRLLNNNVIEVQSAFLSEIRLPNGQLKLMPRNDVGHPWVFGRLYNVKFLRENKIEFSGLRAMEDGEFNWKVRMLVEGTAFGIQVINHPTYIWRKGSEHSITRIGEKDGIPQYNFDLCQVGATQAMTNAIRFVREKNPFNPSLMKMVVETFIKNYFTYVECIGRRKEFAEQNMWLAKKFYNEVYKDYEAQITEKAILDMYTQINAGSAQSLVGIIPEISFKEYLTLVKQPFDINEIKEIRAKLPQDIIDNDLKSGVLGSEAFEFLK